MFGERGDAVFFELSDQDCMISVRGLSVVGVRWAGEGYLRRKAKVHRRYFVPIGEGDATLVLDSLMC